MKLPYRLDLKEPCPNGQTCDLGAVNLGSLHCQECRYFESRNKEDFFVTCNFTDTNYEGCHPKIAEALQKGEHIKCLIKHCSPDSPRMVVAYIKEDTHPYVTYDGRRLTPYREAKPIPKTVMKSALATLKILISDGYTIDSAGCWVSRDGDTLFQPSLWQYCGKTVVAAADFDPKWLEEVELETNQKGD